jgi:hypothetical protein
LQCETQPHVGCLQSETNWRLLSYVNTKFGLIFCDQIKSIFFKVGNYLAGGEINTLSLQVTRVEHIPSRPCSLFIRPLKFMQSQISRHAKNKFPCPWNGGSTLRYIAEDQWTMQSVGWIGSGRVMSGRFGSGKLLLVLTSTVILGSESQGTHHRILLPHDFGSLENLSNPTTQCKLFNIYIWMIVSNTCLQL